MNHWIAEKNFPALHDLMESETFDDLGFKKELSKNEVKIM